MEHCNPHCFSVTLNRIYFCQNIYKLSLANITAMIGRTLNNRRVECRDNYSEFLHKIVHSADSLRLKRMGEGRAKFVGKRNKP